MTKTPRDHGGGLDAAVAQFGGHRSEWLDLSTGINPVPYPITPLSADAWAALPDSGAYARLIAAARTFWDVPSDVEIVAAPGASSLIAAMPHVFANRSVSIPAPTYNEHAAAFRAQGYEVTDTASDMQVLVHPNNPDGQLWKAADIDGPTVLDESFCDTLPDLSHVALAQRENVVVLKSFGKFWGLAGMRLGFALATPDIAAKIKNEIGPWAVSGPALEIGATALEDVAWAHATRARLEQDAARLDDLICATGANIVGGTTLFRLYDVENAVSYQNKLAEGKVWSRVFPYSGRWIRLGLPASDRWDQLEAAL